MQDSRIFQALFDRNAQVLWLSHTVDGVGDISGTTLWDWLDGCQSLVDWWPTIVNGGYWCGVVYSLGRPFRSRYQCVKLPHRKRPHVDNEVAAACVAYQLPPLDHLPPKQQRVAVAFAKGKSVLEIANEHDITPETVRSHLAQIRHKFGLRDGYELARLLADPFRT